MVRTGDRAQLILAGALLLAAIVFGVSFLLSSVLSAGATAGGGAEGSMTDTERLNDEVNRGIRSLVVRVNHAGSVVTESEIEAAVAANVTQFSRLFGESKAAAGPTAVNVSFDGANSTVGYRLTQTADAEFEDYGGEADWVPIPDDQDASIGWFTANVEVRNTSSDPFTVVARNDSGANIVIQMEENDGNLSVQSVPSYGPSRAGTCVPTGGRVLLDLFDGNAFNANCSFHGVGLLGDPIELEFSDADRIEGRFSIVANNSSSDHLNDEYYPCTAGPATVTDPCLHPVVWSANLSTDVQSDRVTYQSSYNLSIYPGAA